MDRQKKKMHLEDRLKYYMLAGYPVLYLQTFEEARALTAVKTATAELGKQAHMMRWDPNIFALEEDIEAADGHTVLVLTDSSVLDEQTQSYDQGLSNTLKKLVARVKTDDQFELTIVIISPFLQFPRELEKDITVVPVEYLTEEEIEAVISEFAGQYGLVVAQSFRYRLASAMKGLSATEIQNILSLAYVYDTDLTEQSLKLVFDEKKQMILKSGLLEMIQPLEGMEQIGGLENLKAWLKRKAQIFEHAEDAKEFGVDIPKGVLIVGVPGTGKSLTAKATAKQFDIPLLRLDMGRLFGKYLGESEANMRRAIELSEATAPCVLWVDELEKAFAGVGGSSTGGEVTTRLFGSFLTWMQEKTSPVFVVATANDITKLPPELLRKGRFDEIFFVALPSYEERRKIFEIHVKKRRPNDLSRIDCVELAEQSEGYSGADIEGVVKEAVEIAFTDKKKSLTNDILLNVLDMTSPLSEIMHDSIKNMMEEYEKRKFKNASRED